MRILVTGGAGYIGSHVVLDLLEAKHELLVLDDLSSGSPENIFSTHPSCYFVQADYSSPVGLKAILEFKPRVVFHFAARKAAGLSMRDPEEYSQHNIRKSLCLIENLAASQCRYFVFSSSAAIYGEPHYLPLDEKHPLKPVNYYGFTKQVIEDDLLWFSRLGRLRCALLRYFNSAGYDLKGRINGIEKEPNNLIPIIMEVVIGKRKELEIFGTDYDTPDGTCIRDYIHVNDLSRAHLLAMEYIIKNDMDICLNLGAERGYSVWEVLQASQDAYSREIPHRTVGRREGDSAHLVSSSKLAYKSLGWRAEHSRIEEIVKSTRRVYEKKLFSEKDDRR